MRKILVTGGFGFIGSNLVRYWSKKYPDDTLIILDSMTYAARERYALDALESQQTNYIHLYVDIRDAHEVRKALRVSQPDHVIHLAAESHVCRSIDGPKDFIQTNIVGTFNLLEAFRELWPMSGKDQSHRFHHVSTDEVYGEVFGDDKFKESTNYAPRSPYAASKAASDHLVRAWTHTYGLNTIITNCSNNFGPNQHEEKLVPKAILSAIHGKPMTVYGKGEQVRDWLFVTDHCAAIDKAFHKGWAGDTYCVGGRTELTNLMMIAFVKKSVEKVLRREVELPIVHTNDRPTDDERYAIDPSKLEALGWSANPEMFVDKLDQTVAWYAARELGVSVE